MSSRVILSYPILDAFWQNISKSFFILFSFSGSRFSRSFSRCRKGILDQLMVSDLYPLKNGPMPSII